MTRLINMIRGLFARKETGGKGSDAVVIGHGVAIRGKDGKPGRFGPGGNGGSARVDGSGTAIGGNGGDGW